MEWWIFAPAVSTLCSESEYRVVIFEGFVQMYFFSRFVLSAALLVLFARADVAAKAPLNVVFILADDLGWSDTTLFGTTSLYETPNIERLAAMGMTFRRAYASSPLCSPTRASILTGLSPARHGITAPVCHLPEVHLQAIAATAAAPHRFSTIPQSVTRLDTTHFTLAEALRQQGYATGHFGKWHLGAEPYSPLEHGFDVDLPHHPGPGPAGSYVAPWKFADFDHDPTIPDQHIEDRMAAEAVAFLEANQERPFLLNYWMFSVHAPFDARKALIDKYRGRVRMDQPQRSPTYAAMIESMDDAVGTLLDALERLQLLDRTVIVFASDNGGNMYNLVDGGTPTSNAPLRGGKATLYEGGIRGPAIIACPEITQPGSHSDNLIQSSDYYPTLLELLQVAPQPQQRFDGISIVPAFRGERLRREAIFTYFPHHSGVPDWLPPAIAVHSDHWKLIRIFHGGPEATHRYLLYDLASDVGESINLADQRPELVRHLDSLIEQHLQDTEAVLPLRNPKFDPAKYDRGREGMSALKSSGTSRPAARKRVPQPAVAGWVAGGTCVLEAVNGQLLVRSDGGDPHLVAVLQRPQDGKDFAMQLSMSSESAGAARVYWHGDSQTFNRELSVPFSVKHDGFRHDYKVQLPIDGSLTHLRIDPSSAAGAIQIHSIELRDSAGNVLQHWTF